MGIDEIQVVNPNGSPCAHLGGARLYTRTIGDPVEWNGLGLAGSTKRNTGILVGCIGGDSAGFSIRADARGDHYSTRVLHNGTNLI